MPISAFAQVSLTPESRSEVLDACGTAVSIQGGLVRTAGAAESEVAPAVLALRAGRHVLILGPPPDSSGGQCEAYLMMAASQVSPELVAFMVRHTSGVLCVALDADTCDRLHLSQMVRENDSHVRAAFTVSVDAQEGVSTGISAADRARTIALLAEVATHPEDLSRPGHVFPLRSERGGVLARPRFTEATVELITAAGLGTAGVLAALMNDDGAPLSSIDVQTFSARHQIPCVSIAGIVSRRRSCESSKELDVNTILDCSASSIAIGSGSPLSPPAR